MPRPFPTELRFEPTHNEYKKGSGRRLLGETLDAHEERFPWAGTTRRSVALFLLRHSLYHIGEMNAMLFRGSNGAIADPWME